MVEIIPKPAAELPLWQNILFYLSLALVLGAILSYFIFGNLQKQALTTLENLEKALVREKTPQEEQLEEKVFNYQNKINDFSILLEKHQFSSNFFQFFESISHPKVWFSQFDLNLNEGKLIVSGEAESFQTLGQQMLIFQSQEEIIKADLSAVSLGEKGKIKFTFTIFLNPRLFK